MGQWASSIESVSETGQIVHEGTVVWPVYSIDIVFHSTVEHTIIIQCNPSQTITRYCSLYGICTQSPSAGYE